MKCAGVNCPNDASKLQCPTCKSLSLPSSTSFFCSQECFKANWAVHKLTAHTINASSSGASYNPWPNYRYTGKLRPFPYGPKRTVPSHIPRPDYADTGIPTSEEDVKKTSKIKVLSPEEIDGMRTVCRLAREVLDIAAAAIKPGITTDEIDRIVHEACIERNAYPSPLNYYGFPKSCCTSVNEVICHGIPDLRPLEDGDIVNIDVTLYYNGFHGDLNETYFVGKVDEVGKRLVECSRKCLEEAIKVCRPGVLYRDLGDVISKIAHEQKFSVVKSYCGHGIHSLFHCPPNVPHYANNRAVGTMKPGHVFTIEPMINEGNWKDEHWPDQWTAVTVDGKRSAQFEHTLLITENGVEILTAGTRT